MRDDLTSSLRLALPRSKMGSLAETSGIQLADSSQTRTLHKKANPAGTVPNSPKRAFNQSVAKQPTTFRQALASAHFQRFKQIMRLSKDGCRTEAALLCCSIRAELGDRNYELLKQQYLASQQKGRALQGYRPKATERNTVQNEYKIESSGRRSYPGPQREENCIPQSCRQAILAATGHKLSEEEAIELAKTLASFYDPNKGMYATEAYKILESQGVASLPVWNTPDEIQDALMKGRAVTSIHDSGVLWGISPDKFIGGHAVQVICVIRNRNSEVTHYVVNDTGPGRGAAMRIPAQLFEASLMPSRNAPVHFTLADFPATITEKRISYGGRAASETRRQAAKEL